MKIAAVLSVRSLNSHEWHGVGDAIGSDASNQSLILIDYLQYR